MPPGGWLMLLTPRRSAALLPACSSCRAPRPSRCTHPSWRRAVSGASAGHCNSARVRIRQLALLCARQSPVGPRRLQVDDTTGRRP
ncbi:hypothetical protein PF005_g281 [Phytophthora fragariae]|uniref:Secreted protein n=2 Tax=Phytophthora TaxID=4783 RepID=A0A6A3TQA3_9STRA|nr:hypothetical protein PF003_g26369 [Phytophthora fragariae]KAE9023067.1 hypothetical protein PR001_g12999 [Phytophthora rubi]KAE8950238.1 hypothetical protein PF009_g229 [Phytophthora fragariae]KAE9026682.1 hypothetical protein PF011_g2423 [Phytophthora fragariae]KAE9048156.1 hypothetical protein PR002_g633 [Phytophthora rubi]